MSAVLEAQNAIRALAAEAGTLPGARMTHQRKSARMDEIEAAIRDHQGTIAAHRKAVELSPGGSSLKPGELSPALSGMTGTKSRIAPLELPERALKGLHQAAVSRQSLRVDAKAADDFEGYLPPVLAPAVQRISEPTRVASLFLALSMTGPVVEYPRITGQTGAAAIVAPGALKPAVGLLTDLVTARAEKIAGLLTVQDESLADFPNFAGIVQAELMRAVIAAENTELLTGDGTTGHLSGLLTQAGITRTATVGETALDTVEQAMTDLRSGPAFATPDGIVMNPADWSKLRREKDSQNRYLLTADATADVVPSLWGCSVILTSDMPAGTAVVGAFQLGATLHVRQGMVLEVNNRSDSDWTHNTSTFRAELREALAVMRPAAFAKVTLPA